MKKFKKFRKVIAIIASLALILGVFGSVPFVAQADTTTVLYDFEDGVLPSTVTTVNQNTAVVEGGTSSMATKHLKVSNSVNVDPQLPGDYVRVNLPTQSSTIKDVTFDYYSIAPDRFRNHIGFITEVNGQEYFYLSDHYNNAGLGNGDSATNYSFIGKNYGRAKNMNSWYDGWTNVTITADIIKDIKALIFQVPTINAYQLLVDNIKITTEGAPVPSTYSVTYNGNGATSGTVPTDSTVYPAEGTGIATVLGNTGDLQKTNAVFTGWNTKADGSGDSYVAGNTFTVSGNTTLYAQWQKTGNQYLYVKNDYSSATPDSMSTLWLKLGDGAGNKITFKAKSEGNTGTLRVFIKNNSGSDLKPTSPTPATGKNYVDIQIDNTWKDYTVEFGSQAIAMATFGSKDGAYIDDIFMVVGSTSTEKYTFENTGTYYTTPSETPTRVECSSYSSSVLSDTLTNLTIPNTKNNTGTNNIYVDSAHSFYGYIQLCKEELVKYTVDFDLNGYGTSGTPAPQEISGGGKVTKPADPTDPEKEFAGWYTNQECTGSAWNFDTTVTGDMTLYAKWVDPATEKDYLSSTGRINGHFVIDGNTVTATNAVPTAKAGSYIAYVPDDYTMTIDGTTYADGVAVTVSGGETVTFSKNGLTGLQVLKALGSTFNPDLNDTNKYLRIDNNFSGGAKALTMTIPSTYGKLGGYLQSGMKVHIRYKATANKTVPLQTRKNQGKSMGVETVETKDLNFTTSWQTVDWTLTKDVPHRGDWIPENKSSLVLVFPQTSDDITYFIDDVIVYNSNGSVYATVDDYENYYRNETLIAHITECSDKTNTWNSVHHPYWSWTGDLTVVSNDTDPRPQNLTSFTPPAKSYQAFWDWTDKIETGVGNRRGDRYSAGLGDTNLWEDAYAPNVNYNCTNYYGDYGNYINTNGSTYTGSGVTPTINAFNIDYGSATTNYDGVMMRITALEGNTVSDVKFELKRGYKTENFGVPPVGQSSIIVLPWSAFGGTDKIDTDFNFYFGTGVMNLAISDMYFYKDAAEIDMVLRANINQANETNSLMYNMDLNGKNATKAYVNLKSSMPSFYNATCSLLDGSGNVISTQSMASLTKDWKKYEIDIPSDQKNNVKKIKIDVGVNGGTARNMYYVYMNSMGYTASDGDHDVVTFDILSTRAFPIESDSNTAGIQYGNENFGGAGGTWYGSMWYETDSSRDYSEHGFIAATGEVSTAKWKENNTEVRAADNTGELAQSVVNNFKFFATDNTVIGQEKSHTLWIDTDPTKGGSEGRSISWVYAQIFKGSHSGTAADPEALGDLQDVITAAQNSTGKLAVKISRDDTATGATVVAKFAVTYDGDSDETIIFRHTFASNSEKDVEIEFDTSWFVNPDGSLKNIECIDFGADVQSGNAKINVGVSEIYAQRPELKVKAHALVLADNISMQYKIPKAIFSETFYKTDGMTVDFNINGKTQSFSFADAVDDGTYYVFTESKNEAKEMCDTITATIKALYDHEEEMTTAVDNYSVKQYAIDILSDPTYASDTTLHTLVSDILYYGRAAQLYTGYNTGNLPTENLTPSAEGNCVRLETASGKDPQIMFQIPEFPQGTTIFYSVKAVNSNTTKVGRTARQVNYTNGAYITSAAYVDHSISTDWAEYTYQTTIANANMFGIHMAKDSKIVIDDIGYIDASGNRHILFDFNSIERAVYMYRNVDGDINNPEGMIAIGAIYQRDAKYSAEGGIKASTCGANVYVEAGGAVAPIVLTPTDISTVTKPWESGSHIAEFGAEGDKQMVVWKAAALSLENSTAIRFKITSTKNLLGGIPYTLHIDITLPDGTKKDIEVGSDNLVANGTHDVDGHTAYDFILYVRGLSASWIANLNDSTFQWYYTSSKKFTISTPASYNIAKYVYQKWTSDFKNDAGSMYLSEFVKYVWAYGLSVDAYVKAH